MKIAREHCFVNTLLTTGCDHFLTKKRKFSRFLSLAKTFPNGRKVKSKIFKFSKTRLHFACNVLLNRLFSAIILWIWQSKFVSTVFSPIPPVAFVDRKSTRLN